MTPQIHWGSEVAAARADGVPVVALESTIITHGMPFPVNLETARAVEAEIRAQGAIPATIAVIDGKIRVGLSTEELDDFAERQNVMKLSRADLPFALATRRTGSTTVAATMIVARLADIAVFATGGIGGVHRGAEHSFDISADLQELAHTPVTVVSAGAKAILDIPKTLEVLETLGVPVFTIGQQEFPAFWSRHSGHPSPLVADSLEDVAKSQLMRKQMGIPGGQLLANPVPLPDEIPRATIEPHIETAIAEAASKGMTSKQITPFLLQRIFELTGGASLETNIKIIKNNAKTAAQLAICLQRLD